MFENVLVGVDGNQGGRDAVALASRLIAPGGKLTLAHVHSGELHPLHIVTPGRVREESTASRELLESEREGAAVEAELISLVAMSPGRSLHRQAEEQRADLLVVGSCSRGLLGRAMLGDDTRESLNGAPCAVAVAPVGYAAHPTPITKIGVAYDGSQESRAALEEARGLAAATGASIHALEVVPLPSLAWTGVISLALAEFDGTLKEARRRMAELPGVEGDAVHGLAGEELATFGEKVDVLIAGSRGYGPVKRLVLGSASSYLQRHARCAVVILTRGSVTAPVGRDTELASGEPAAQG